MYKRRERDRGGGGYGGALRGQNTHWKLLYYAPPPYCSTTVSVFNILQLYSRKQHLDDNFEIH